MENLKACILRYLSLNGHLIAENLQIFQRLPPSLQAFIVRKLKKGKIHFAVTEKGVHDELSNYQELALHAKTSALRREIVKHFFGLLNPQNRKTLKHIPFEVFRRYLKLYEVWQAMRQTIPDKHIWENRQALCARNQFFLRYTPAQKQNVADYFLQQAKSRSTILFAQTVQWVVRYELLPISGTLSLIKQLIPLDDGELIFESKEDYLYRFAQYSARSRRTIANASLRLALSRKEGSSDWRKYTLARFYPYLTPARQYEAAEELFATKNLGTEALWRLYKDSFSKDISKRAKAMLMERDDVVFAAQELLKQLKK